MTGTVARLIKQTKPFSSVEAEIQIAFQRAATRLMDPFQAYLKDAANLSVSQYNALRILRGVHPGRLPSSEISNRMVSKDPDITRLVDRLEDRGLVDRQRNTTDRRVVEVGITKQGLALLKKLDAAVDEYPRVMLGHLGEDRLRQLLELLEALLEAPATFPRASRRAPA